MIQALQATSQYLDAAFDSCRAPLSGTSPVAALPWIKSNPRLLLGHTDALHTRLGEEHYRTEVLQLPLILSLRLESSSAPFVRVSSDS